MCLIKIQRKKQLINLGEIKRKITSKFDFLSSRIKRRTVILKLKKADIIMAKPRLFSLSPLSLLYRIILRSDYVHSMLYIGNSKIIHTTTKDGVTIHNVPWKIYKKNNYTIFRVKGLNSETRDQIVNEALKLQDMKIDLLGLISNIPRNLFGIKKSFSKIEKNSIWCSKLIYQSYSTVGIKLVEEDESGKITSDILSKSKLLKVIL